MTPRNFTCIAKGHFLLELIMYKYLSTTDYIHHSSSDCQVINCSMSTLQGPDLLYKLFVTW